MTERGREGGIVFEEGGKKEMDGVVRVGEGVMEHLDGKKEIDEKEKKWKRRKL